MKPSSDVASADEQDDDFEQGLAEITDHLSEAVLIAQRLKLNMLEHFLRMAAFETGTLLASHLRRGDVSSLQ